MIRMPFFIPLALALLIGCAPPEEDIADDIPDAGVIPDAWDAGDNQHSDGGSEVPDSGTSPTPDAGPTADDTDGDGLDDDWENAAGDLARLDPNLADSDDDGTPDGLEDPDGDGLSNLDEFAAQGMAFFGQAPPPHPLRRDLLIELDEMTGRTLSDEILTLVVDAYADLPLENADGTTGVHLHILRDESSITPTDFDGSFEERFAFFAAHPPQGDDGQSPPLPLDQLLHVMTAKQRLDIPARGGETVSDANGVVENTGVLIYVDVIQGLHPDCGVGGANPVPDITAVEALAGTFIHEVGHALQLGHDTEVGGGINTFNIMSLPQNCAQAQERANGEGNDDATLGATQSVGEPRFSVAASELMDFTHKVSVDTATFDEPTGHEM